MPAADLAAKRYAEAAFQIALEKGNLDEWSAAISEIAAMYSEAEVKAVLENSRMSLEAKYQLIDKLLTDLQSPQRNLARLLVRKSRVGLVKEIAEEFSSMVEEREGIVRAKVFTAVPITDSERAQILQALRQRTGREVILDVEVDPELLGGIVIQMGDRLIDASTRARLESLRESLVGAV